MTQQESEQIKAFVDSLVTVEEAPQKPTEDTTESAPEPVKVEVKEEKPKPEGKRAARSPGTGDKVYILDTKEKTKHWVTTEKILNEQGFELGEVENLEDSEINEYRLGAAIYR